MRLRSLRLVPIWAVLLVLAAPALAAIAAGPAGGDPNSGTDIAVNTVWVVVTATLVLFMQAGFAMLEIGLSRMKNAGAVAGKILVNVAIAFIMYWAIGFAIGFGNGNDFWGHSGWFMNVDNFKETFSSLAYSNTPLEAQYFFEVVFCAVSIAIVFGTMLDRTKFSTYVIFAVVFTGVIYPIVQHWTWGGGWLLKRGFQDFAGSSIVHLQGALAALAGTLLLGPRIGKFRNRKAVPIPGHSIPLAVLGVIILWIGWMGFNPGSWLNGINVNFADVAVNTNLAACAGIIGATLASLVMFKTIDVSQMGNGAIAALVAITAPCAFVDPWAAVLIGLVAGLIVPAIVVAVDKLLVDDPIGAIPAHGVAGMWGTLAAGLFTTPERAVNVAVGDAGLFYGGGLGQLGVQALGIAATVGFTFTASFVTFYAIKKTLGLRVKEEDELRGLDISEHGMYGYPERFIDVPGATPEEIPLDHAPSPVGATTRPAPAAT
jgi:ammonium transporter, Amt family